MNINMTLDDTLLHAGLIYRCTHCFDAVKEEPASCHLCRFSSAKRRRPHIFTLRQCIIYGSSTYGQNTSYWLQRGVWSQMDNNIHPPVTVCEPHPQKKEWFILSRHCAYMRKMWDFVVPHKHRPTSSFIWKCVKATCLDCSVFSFFNKM